VQHSRSRTVCDDEARFGALGSNQYSRDAGRIVEVDVHGFGIGGRHGDSMLLRQGTGQLNPSPSAELSESNIERFPKIWARLDDLSHFDNLY
jgi:hypothetical protein